MELSENLKSKLSRLPEKPGVYLMRDLSGQIIYIGKAVILKNRVRQYFFNRQTNQKVQAMVEQIADFDYFITLSEKDALALEANLVRKEKPRYNILLKDDKHSPYIRIDLMQKFPCLEITRKVKSDGAKYFGPFFHGVRAAEVLAVIKSAYRVRCCPKNFQGKKRACLNHDIELCLGPCAGKVSEEEYRAAVKKTVAFLSGDETAAERVLEEKMQKAVDMEEFERAIVYRDRLAMVKRLKERTLSELAVGTDLDAVAAVTDGQNIAVSVVVVRSGKMMGVKNFPPLFGAVFGEDAYGQILAQYYAEQGGAVPPEILLCKEFDSTGLEEYLGTISGKKTAVSFPKIGMKKKLLLMAEENARETLEKSRDKTEREYGLCEGACKALGEVLGIRSNIRRIECYDISHVSGTDQVASGVVFINGRPEKKEYRRYKIKSVEGADDYASMKEVVTRRLERAKSGTRTFAEGLPDLMVIDGGKGQLSSAQEAMRNCGFTIPMIALAERDEEIFTPGNADPIVLSKNHAALKLLQRVRDEAHRFAVDFHHTRRSKRISSVLEEIPGVGPKKRQILLKAFASLEKIKAADIETLAAVEGIDRKTAESVAAFFKK